MFNIFDNSFLLNNLELNRERYQEYVMNHGRVGGLARTLLSFDWDKVAQKERVIQRVVTYLRQAEIGCSQPVFTAEGPNGTGKSHVIAGICRWLILNKGLSYPGWELEWVTWPTYVKERLDNTLSREPNWRAMILVIEDIDTAMAISSKTQNAYGLRDLLGILRERIESNNSLPTLMSFNKSLKVKGSYPLMEALSVDTQGEVVPDAAKNAKTLTDLLIGSSIRAVFVSATGHSYRDTVLSSLSDWKRVNAERHRAANPMTLLGIEGEF